MRMRTFFPRMRSACLIAVLLAPALPTGATEIVLPEEIQPPRQSVPAVPADRLIVCLTEAVTGTITDAGGKPLSGISLWLKKLPNSIPASIQTDAAGQYTFCVEPGDYALAFNTTTDNDFLGEVYNNKNFGCGDKITVPPGGNVVIDAALSLGGSVSGTVTNGASPLAGVHVRAFGAGSSRAAVTDAAGRYRVGGLYEGEYRVSFSHPSRAYEYYGDTHVYADAVPVTVVRGQEKTGIDAALGPGGSISGTIDDGTLPVQNAGVLAWNPGIGVLFKGDTDAAGAYSITGLSAADYKVRVIPFSGQEQWYSGTTRESDAALLTVAPPLGVAGVDMTIKPAGSISGVVSYGGTGVASVFVHAYDRNGRTGGTALTAADGSYTLGNLLDGRYRVHAEGWQAGHRNLWYGGTARPEDATVVTVSGASFVTGADIILAPAAMGTMSGKIGYQGGPCGSAMFGTGVNIYPEPAIGQSQGGVYLTSPLAEWQSPPLAPGRYVVQVYSSADRHGRAWYPRGKARNRARSVTVRSGADRGGVDVTLPRERGLPETDIYFRTPEAISEGYFGSLINMEQGDRLPLYVDLDCGKAKGYLADMWLLAFTLLPPPRNVYHYEIGSGWQQGLAVTEQGPCVDIDELQLREIPYYPLGGDLDIYFGVDGVMNGALDPGTLFYNGVRAHMYK